MTTRRSSPQHPLAMALTLASVSARCSQSSVAGAHRIMGSDRTMNDRIRRLRNTMPRRRGSGLSDPVAAAPAEDTSQTQSRAHTPYAPRPGQPFPAPYARARYREEALEEEQAGPHTLALPFPLWLTLGAPIALAITLALVYLVETTLLGGDWATGALAVSFTAFALTVVTLGLLVGRVALDRRSFGSIALGGLLALVLVVTGVGGATQANPLRQAQARQAETSGNWQFAIDEYTQAGAHAPTSADLARVYTEWGEA